jgi:hypothetical protein
MSDPLWQRFALAVIPTVISGYAGYRYGLCQAKKLRLHKFISEIDVVLAKIDRCHSESELKSVREETATIVCEQYARVRQDIRDRDGPRFESAARDYYEMAEYEDGRLARGLSSVLFSRAAGNPPLPTPHDRRQRMVQALQTLKDCAK